MSKRDFNTGKENPIGKFGYYYLHENGDLIYKNTYFDPFDFEDSPFCKIWWKIDFTERADCYNMLIRAIIAGANMSRVEELLIKWGINDADCQNYINRFGLVSGKEGAGWMVADPDKKFIGRGPTMFKALVMFYYEAVPIRIPGEGQLVRLPDLWYEPKF